MRFASSTEYSQEIARAPSVRASVNAYSNSSSEYVGTSSNLTISIMTPASSYILRIARTPSMGAVNRHLRSSAKRAFAAACCSAVGGGGDAVPAARPSPPPTRPGWGWRRRGSPRVASTGRARNSTALRPSLGAVENGLGRGGGILEVVGYVHADLHAGNGRPLNRGGDRGPRCEPGRRSGQRQLSKFASGVHHGCLPIHSPS